MTHPRPSPRGHRPHATSAVQVEEGEAVQVEEGGAGPSGEHD